MFRAFTLACLVLFALASTSAAQEESPAMPHIQAAQPKLQAQDWKGALADLNKAVEADAKFWRAYYFRALVRQRLGEHKSAIADIDTAFTLEPSADQAWQLYKVRGISKQDLGMNAAAEEDYTKAIALQTRDHYLFIFRAQVRKRQENFQGAVEDYTTLSGLAPQWEEAYLGRGEAKARLGDYDGAMEDLDAAVYLAETKSRVYTVRGRVKLGKGDIEDGMSDFDKGVELAADKEQALFSRGLARFDTGDLKGALADFEEALKRDPKTLEYAALYRCLANRSLGKAADARKEMKAFLDARENKDDWFARVARFLAGDLIEKDFLSAAEHKNPNTASQQRCEAYWYAGALKRIAGDHATAKQYFQRCVDTKQLEFIEWESATWALKEKK